MSKYIDADKLIANLERQNVDKKVIEPVIRIIDSLEQEQQEVDLEKEMSRFIRTYFTKPEYDKDFIAEVDWENSMRECAHYFYGLGQLNSK